MKFSDIISGLGEAEKDFKEAKDLLVEVLMQTQETHTPEMEKVIGKIRAYLERDRASERLADPQKKDESGTTKTGS